MAEAQGGHSMETVQLAVNGTLMRGFALNRNLLMLALRLCMKR